MNEIKVLHSVVPKLYLFSRPRIVSRLESCLWILLKHVFDLSSPCVDGSFKDVSLVFVWLWGISDVLWGKWKLSLTLDLAVSYYYLCKETVQLVHKVLEVDWNYLVVLCLISIARQDRHKNIVCKSSEIFKDLFGNLNERDSVCHIVIYERFVLVICFEANWWLLLHLTDHRKSLLEDHHVRSFLHCKQHCVKRIT